MIPPVTAHPTKSARTRQRILDAAARIFSEQGYANARLSDIAELAGIQTGSLYYHFDGREDLVAEILRLGIEMAWTRVRTALDALAHDAAPIDRLAAAIRAHTLAVLEKGEYASAQARIAGQVPADVRRSHLADQRAYGAYWNELFAASQAAGQLRADADLVIVRMLTFGALNWTSEWFSPDRVTATTVADQAVALVINGLVPDPTSGDRMRDIPTRR